MPLQMRQDKLELRRWAAAPTEPTTGLDTVARRHHLRATQAMREEDRRLRRDMVAKACIQVRQEQVWDNQAATVVVLDQPWRA